MKKNLWLFLGILWVIAIVLISAHAIFKDTATTLSSSILAEKDEDECQCNRQNKAKSIIICHCKYQTTCFIFSDPQADHQVPGTISCVKN